MKILIIGSGGREHALAWRLAQSSSVRQVFATPGNPGIAQGGECIPSAGPAPMDYVAVARQCGADLTVVGPEVPLVAGVVDAFRSHGLDIIGPTAEQAQLEGSKIHAKRFFAESGIPTATFATISSIEEARSALSKFSLPVVIKADGLAAGKGVVIAHNAAEAEEAIRALGPKLVIEEYLEGEEASFIVLCDGQNVLALEPCQDHKPVFDGDRGPNTGGMGAYCDGRILTQAQRDEILERIIRPTVRATGFTGFLYAGLMITVDGPKLLEYNVRLGDPETQPIMHRMVGDFGEVLRASARGELAGGRLEWRAEPSICVVLASEGYPGTPRMGVAIQGIEEAEALGATVFHAGTKLGSQGLETAGGRVLGVTHRAPVFTDAIRNTYEAVSKIRFEGMHFRTDIGSKGLRRYN